MDWTSVFQTILPYLPAKYAGDLVSILTFLIAADASRAIEAARLGLDPASTHPKSGEPPKVSG